MPKTEYCVCKFGMSNGYGVYQNGNLLHSLEEEWEANTICRLLQEAYEAGRSDERGES